MQKAAGTLQRAAETEDPVVVFAVAQKAVVSALKVIVRADDSSGIIGDACRALLDLDPKVAAGQAAGRETGRLANDVPVGQRVRLLRPRPRRLRLGARRQRHGLAPAKLADLEAGLGPRPRELDKPVNHKRVQRVMREHKLLQRNRKTDRRRRPGFFRVNRPDEL